MGVKFDFSPWTEEYRLRVFENTYSRGKWEIHKKISSGYLKEKDYLGYLDEEEKIFGLKETGCDVVDFIHLAQDRDQLRTPVITARNCLVP
jgi:hypothetical protein